MENSSRGLVVSAEELMHFLTHCVRLFTAQQLEIMHARAIAERLATRGWLFRQRVCCAPSLQLAQPLESWLPGRPPPDFASVSYRARSRWRNASRWTLAYVASRRGARHFGGRGGPLKNPLQATHDVHVAEILLLMRRADPHLAAGWVGEDAMESRFPMAKVRRPDAFLVGPSGAIKRVVEFVGAYPPDRIASIHDQCAQASWRYDLW